MFLASSPVMPFMVAAAVPRSHPRMVSSVVRGAPAALSPVPRHEVRPLVLLTCAIWSATAGSGAGYLGLIASSAVTRSAAVASRANHLWSACTTYHGAHGVLVWLSIVAKARW